MSNGTFILVAEGPTEGQVRDAVEAYRKTSGVTFTAVVEEDDSDEAAWWIAIHRANYADEQRTAHDLCVSLPFAAEVESEPALT